MDIIVLQMKTNFDTIKTKHILWTGMGVAFVLVILSFVFSNIKTSYKQNVEDYRSQRNDFFRHSPFSPIEDKEAFTTLDYFIPNPKFKVEAELYPLSDSSEVTITRNDGRKDTYKKFATASFTLEKKPLQLTLLISKDSSNNELNAFIPFSDKTNGGETYSGGRYLDLRITDKKHAVIDFNFAYNPFCVYSYKYSCPLPPPENHLDIEILAGEKIWEKPQEK